jgi:hypothetical protein
MEIEIELTHIATITGIEIFNAWHEPTDVGFCSEYMKTVNNTFTQIILF